MILSESSGVLDFRTVSELSVQNGTQQQKKQPKEEVLGTRYLADIARSFGWKSRENPRSGPLNPGKMNSSAYIHDPKALHNPRVSKTSG